MKMNALSPLILPVLVFAARPAVAEEPAEPIRVESQVPWTEPAGQGVAFGYDNGSWGGAFFQSLRVRIPVLGRAGTGGFSIAPRAIFIHHPSPDRFDLGARLDFVGHSPVFLNLVRLYGGGGPQIFAPVTDEPGVGAQFGGGGHFGFEFFMSEMLSIYAEIGGQGGYEALNGATIAAGIQVYPF